MNCPKMTDLTIPKLRNKKKGGSMLYLLQESQYNNRNRFVDGYLHLYCDVLAGVEAVTFQEAVREIKTIPPTAWPKKRGYPRNVKNVCGACEFCGYRAFDEAPAQRVCMFNPTKEGRIVKYVTLDAKPCQNFRARKIQKEAVNESGN